jgi:cation/acetate symporter
MYLMLAGALAAALAALGAALLTTATILSEDVVHGLRADQASEAARMTSARMGLAGAACVAAWLALAAPADPFKLFLWALNFSAAAVFPVLVLSIWWKRINAWGAATGMVAGVAVAALGVLLGEAGAWPLPGVLAAALGLPAAVIATMTVSLLTPVPGAGVLGRVHEMRVPGGETLYDREVRLQRLKARTAS